jgi:hypothetical protein
MPAPAAYATRFTTPTPVFSADDVGKIIRWDHNGVDAYVTITTYVSPTEVLGAGFGSTYTTYAATLDWSIPARTKRFVERMESRLLTDMKSAFFVDSGLSFDGRNTTATTLTLSGGTNWDETETIDLRASAAIFAYPATTDIGDQLVYEDTDTGSVYRLNIVGVTSTTEATATPDKPIPAVYRVTRADWAWARDTFTGLDHLENQTVSVLADGFVQPQKVVTGGAISIAPPAVRVHVGLPIEADLETLDLSIPGIETLLPKNKAIHSVSFLVQETQTIKAGRDFTNLKESKGRTTENYDQPINLTTGKVKIVIPTNWDKTANVCMRVDNPVPVGVLAIIPEVTMGGNV